jgi:hypothetical protein
MKNKIITSTLEDSNNLSSTAAALVLPLILHTDDLNMIDKEDFISSVGLKMDIRTWDKYWEELAEALVIAPLGKELVYWMVSPYQCQTEGIPRDILLGRWDLINAAR